MSDDETPDPLAGLDQMLRAAMDIAKLIRGYHQALVAEGFTASEALGLAIDYQQTILGKQ